MKTKVSSSIEYFYEMSTQAFEQYCQGKCSKQQYEYYILVLKAKCQSNHKKEIEDAWNDGSYKSSLLGAKDYYEETFGGNNE